MEEESSSLDFEENSAAAAPMETHSPALKEGYVKRLCRNFPLCFLGFLVVSQFLLKGIGLSLVIGLLLPLFKNELGVEAAQLQLLTMLILSPWALKPIFGLLSDVFLVRGYHKKPWLYVGGAFGCLGGALLFVAGPNRSIPLLAACLIGLHLQISLFDLMSEATFSAMMRDNPSSGSDIVTFTQGLQRAGSVVGLLLVGPLADARVYIALFSIITGLALASSVPLVLPGNWLPEKQAANHRCVSLVPRDAKISTIILFTGLAAPMVALIANVWSLLAGFIVGVLVLAGSLAAGFLWASDSFPRILMQVCAYLVINSLSRPSLGSAMDYYYTADAVCVPGGPNFSFSYYLTVAGLVGALASLVAAVGYQLVLSGMRFRRVLLGTTLLAGLVGASDLIIVTRANVALGIPDKWAFIVGEAVLEPLLLTLNSIPATALISKVVPVGMESSSYAYLAGVSNFAGLLSEASGALIYGAAGIKTVVPCNFDALWWLIVSFHVALPTTVGLLAAMVLIPDTLQDEPLPAVVR